MKILIAILLLCLSWATAGAATNGEICILVFEQMAAGYNAKDKDSAHLKQTVGFPIAALIERMRKVEGPAAAEIETSGFNRLGDAEKQRRILSLANQFNELLKKTTSHDELRRFILEAEGSGDRELSALGREELDKVEKEIGAMTPAFRRDLLQHLDPKHRVNSVILSIDLASTRGAGFEKILEQLSQRYLTMAVKRGWKFELLNGDPNNVTLEISGEGAWSAFNQEAGLHRVEFRTNGRSFTNEAVISVVPSRPPQTVEIKDADVTVETYTASGPGGQHVNKTQSAVRLRHKPSGIVVECQSERSQISNRATALKILKAKVEAKAEEDRAEQERAAKLGQAVVGARRSIPRVRTYDFIANRVTDHRTGEKLVLKKENINDSDMDRLQTRLENDELLRALERAQP